MSPDLLFPTERRAIPTRAALHPVGRAALQLVACTGLLFVGPAFAGVPDLGQCFFVPQAGPVGTPITGTTATALFKACPNNDGGTSLPNNVRVKVLLKDANGFPVGGIAAADICL